MPKTFTVDRDFQNTRFDRWFKNRVLDIPHSLIEKLIRQNKVKVNKKKTKSSYRVQAGDVIDVFDISRLEPKKKNELVKYISNKKELGKFNDFILENNENFIVINKPSGLPVQSGSKSFKNLVDILKDTKYFENKKPFIVHRIDKETSGLLIVAKNRKFAQLFTSLFRLRKIHKTYVAITFGKILNSQKNLEDDLIYYDQNKKIIQKAISQLRVIKSNDLFSYVELKPVTGRKHQLRKQLLNIGHPIVGDSKYYMNNFKKFKINNLMLHAYKIKFKINDVKYNFKAEYNNNFENFLKRF